MATESRIGIGFGFVIVAIASIYFIYGSDRSDGDLLLKTDANVVQSEAKSGPAKLASNTAAKKTPTANKAPKLANGQGSASSHSKTSRTKSPNRAAANKPARPRSSSNRNTSRQNPAKKPTPRQSDPILVRNKDMEPTRRDPIQIPPQRTTDVVAKNSEQTNPMIRAARKKPTRTYRGPTPLNSNASKKLVDATEKNLTPTGNAPKTNTADQAKDTNQTPNGARPTPTRRTKRSDKLVDPAIRAAKNRARQVRPAMQKPTATRRNQKTKTSPEAVIATGKPKSTDAAAPRTHRVVSGDTLSEISMRYYNTSRHVDQILAANPHVKSASKLSIGQELTIPAPKALGSNGATVESASKTPVKAMVEVAQRSKSSETPRTYTVKKGDTFYSIAKQLLGSSTRWKELYRKNKRVVKNKPANLKPGMVLRMPT